MQVRPAPSPYANSLERHFRRNPVAQFLAVCRRSKSVYIGTSRPRRCPSRWPGGSEGRNFGQVASDVSLAACNALILLSYVDGDTSCDAPASPDGVTGPLITDMCFHCARGWQKSQCGECHTDRKFKRHFTPPLPPLASGPPAPPAVAARSKDWRGVARSGQAAQDA